MLDLITGTAPRDHAEHDGNECGLVTEMRRQPRIACAVSWVPLSVPIFASQRPVSVISSSNTTRMSSGICWSAADMRLVAS